MCLSLPLLCAHCVLGRRAPNRTNRLSQLGTWTLHGRELRRVRPTRRPLSRPGTCRPSQSPWYVIPYLPWLGCPPHIARRLPTMLIAFRPLCSRSFATAARLGAVGPHPAFRTAPHPRPHQRRAATAKSQHRHAASDLQLRLPDPSRRDSDAQNRTEVTARSSRGQQQGGQGHAEAAPAGDQCDHEPRPSHRADGRLGLRCVSWGGGVLALHSSAISCRLAWKTARLTSCRAASCRRQARRPS